MNHLCRSLVLALFVILSAVACMGGPAQDNSETNWLMKCASDGQCGGDARCLCGRCTISCTAGQSCAGGPDGTACNTDITCAATSGASGVCIKRCAFSSECGAGLACSEGICTVSTAASVAPIPNPTGSCVAPDDGSRAGYSSIAELTWLPDCQGVLKREYWRVYAVSADRAAMLPRPDGAVWLGAPCNGAQHPLAGIVQKYGLCESAMTPEQVATVNAMSIADAFAVARYLQAQLVFIVTPDGLGIEPFPIPSDILDACNLHADANSADLVAICQRESDRLKSGTDIGFTYTGPGAVELVARLNELYGIRIEGGDGGICVSRPERNSPDTSFIYLANASVTSKPSGPACVATCAIQPSDDDTVASLPAGTCQPATSPCDMTAARPCPCATPNAPSDSYHCACVNARWECVITTKTLGICLPCEGGAPPDAAAE